MAQVDEPVVISPAVKQAVVGPHDLPQSKQARDNEFVNLTQSTSYGTAMEFQRDSSVGKMYPGSSHCTAVEPYTFASQTSKATRFAIGKIGRDTIC